MFYYFKFFFIILICFIANIYCGNILYLFVSILEILIIFEISHIVYKKNRFIGYILNVILSTVFLVQEFTFMFSGEYLSLLMIDNIKSVSVLGSKLLLYIISIIIVFFIIFLPFKFFKYKKYYFILSFIYITSLIYIFFIIGRLSTPISAFAGTITEIVEQEVYAYRSKFEDKKEILKYFYRNSIESGNIKHNYINYGGIDKPNIIVIFTEGLSSEVLDVYNNLHLNLTPNLNKLYKESLSFDNYFNHTAATFRGLRGQLYSSYQYRGGWDRENKGFVELDKDSISKDTNVEIKSIIDILRENGYHSYFINPEPNLDFFYNYLSSFGFDEIYPSNSADKSLSDKESFLELEKSIYKAKEPFFIGFYNIGTHHGMDSPDIKYGDGSNPILNKFHNYDAQFGKWFNKMKSKGLFKNTLLVFTTDHASYNAPEWKKSFNSNQSTFIAKIPLFLYGDGIKSGKMDANGRNSLDLAPTLLDILNITNFGNYFLGNSLFYEHPSKYDKYSSIGNDIYYIEECNSVKKYKSLRDKKIKADISKFFVISLTE